MRNFHDFYKKNAKFLFNFYIKYEISLTYHINEKLRNFHDFYSNDFSYDFYSKCEICQISLTFYKMRNSPDLNVNFPVLYRKCETSLTIIQNAKFPYFFQNAKFPRLFF